MTIKISKTTIIIVLSILIIIICGMVFPYLFKNSQSETETQTAEITETKKTLDFIPAGDERNIAMPGYTGINLFSHQLIQQVDFYNPENNPCYFIMTLSLSDGTIIWESDFISPGEHTKEITLNQILQKGIYQNCILTYDCYSDADTRINGGTCRLEINSR